MQLRAIREALAAAYEAQGFRVYDHLPEQAELPFAAVSWPDRVVYHQSLTGGCLIEIVVAVGVGLADFDEAQEALDDVMSTPGLPDKLDFTTADAWYDASIVEAGNIRQVNVGAQALVVDFVHEIHAE